MASTLIHLTIANELNKQLKRNKKELLLGSIAPDISKLIGKTKEISHFLDKENEIHVPNINNFLNKYKDNLNDDFTLGYYIHLYTDYLWAKYFITEIENRNSIMTLNGEIINLNDEQEHEYIYNDYTNLNIQLIDEYELELSLFFEELPILNNIIEEIPYDKLNILVDKAGIIIEESKKSKSLIFDINNVKKFIDFSTEIIIDKINNLDKEALEIL